MSIWDNLIDQHSQNAPKKGGGDVWGDLITTHGGATPKEPATHLDGPQAPGQPATTQWRGAKFEESTPQTPEEKKLYAELRKKADDTLLQGAETAKSPVYTFLSNTGNTLGVNVPRNVAAATRTLKTGNSFSHEYDYLKSVDEASARRNPVSAVTGTVGGALLQAVAAPQATASTFLGRTGQAAIGGGALSGLSEFMDSKDLNKAKGAATTGAVLGAGGSAAFDGIAKVGGATISPLIDSFRGLINPEKEALRRVQQSISSDVSRGRGGLSKEDMAVADFYGQPTVVADLGGETTQALARSAANHSPVARDELKKVVDSRFEGQSGRVHGMLSDLSETGGTAAPDLQEALKTKARQLNKPAYKAAYDKGANGVWSDDLANLAAAPDVAEAIAGATKTGRNKSVVDGFAPVKNPFNIAEDGTISLKTNPDGSQAIPSLQFWDHVKQNLDDKVTKLRRNGDFQAAADTTALKNKLLEQLDATVPEYATARKGASQFFGANDALEAGQKFVSAGGENAKFAQQIGKFNEAEKKLFAEGFLSSLRDKVSNVGDRSSVLNQIFQSPKARERVSMALGPGKAKEVEAMLHVERIMDELRTTLGNSTTVRQFIEYGLASGGLGAIAFGTGGDWKTSAVTGAALKFGKGKIDSRVSTHIGKLLASSDKSAIEKVVKMAKGNERVMDFIRSFSVAESSQQSPKINGNGQKDEGRK